MKKLWIAITVVVIIIISIFSQNFVLLNPQNGVWTVTKQSNITSATLKIPGLISPVQASIDRSGVAHLFAKNDHDLFLVQGYYEASQRLFQMELQALLASGNLSKFVGSSAIGSDQAMRLVGIPQYSWKLEQSIKQNYPEFYSLIAAFSQGVNDYINASNPLPLEFKLIDKTPFYWSPFDTFVWQGYMTWALTTGAYEPLASALFYTAFGFNQTSQIWPYYPYFSNNITVVPGDGTVNGYNLTSQGISPDYLWSLDWYSSWVTGVDTNLLKSLTPLLKSALENITDPYFPSFTDQGSNSWIVTENYSTTHSPILANDPHLTLLAPSLWIPLQLTDPYMNVTGWGLAGIPGILIGHTQTTAWGLTTPEGNSANEYLEILNGNSYYYNGNWAPMSVTAQNLDGKVLKFYYTNNGPLIARIGNYGISLNWSYSRPSYALITEIMLDRSTTYHDMLHALQYWSTPPQNFAMVSMHHAGILTAGSYHVFKTQLPDGKIVSVVGSRSVLNGTGSYQASGVVPFKYLPQYEDPARGYMFAPNQVTVGMNYPYPFIGGYWASGGRAESIYHFLKSNSMNIQTMMQLQSNVSDYWASQFTPYIIRALNNMNLNASGSLALSYLNLWNYTTYQNEIGMTVYWYFLAEFYNLSIDHLYQEHDISFLPHPFENTIIYLAKTNPESVWFNGNFTALARSAFLKEIAFLENKLGSVSAWHWGRVHQLYINSITTLPALSLGPIPIWGDDHTVSVGSTVKKLIVPEPYVTVSSSLRFIASPGTAQFFGVFPGGLSENVLSYYYSNQLNYWLNHNYYNMSTQLVEVRIYYE